MKPGQERNNCRIPAWTVLLLMGLCPIITSGQTITPSAYWKNQVAFPDDPLYAMPGDGVRWVKFTILLAPYDPNVVYFQDRRKYVFHYNFAVENLDPFVGMTSHQFDAVTLSASNQQAILGTVVLPPLIDGQSTFQEYGVQFVRQEPYTREQIRDLFHLITANVNAADDVQAFYFPTYAQQAVAQANRTWFEAEGIPLGSTGQWADSNVGYSQGWALGTLKFVPAGSIEEAYRTGFLGPDDILLTDGIPADLPFLSGIISLVPATPNSHVAILARTQAVPFAYLALAADAERARQLVGHRIVFSVYDDGYGSYDTRLIDTDGILDETLAAEILQLKAPKPLAIAPMAPYGALGLSTDGLRREDAQYVGGKAANFGMLREAIGENSPRAVGLTFDLWNAFLDQPLTPPAPIVLGPGEHIVFWADDNERQGPTHAGFRLSKEGEAVGLYAADGTTLIDAISFGPQLTDVSYGRFPDGGEMWHFMAAPTPGRPNSSEAPAAGSGLVINEFMADNKRTIQAPDAPGQYPDWIELYNASDEAILLNGLYLTDDLNEPTKWQIAPLVTGPTLRDEIARILGPHQSYRPADMQALTADLASIRNLFTHPTITAFDEGLRADVLAVLTTPNYDFDPHAPLRFRSSTNVEDSEDYTGAGLYDSFTGCLADDLGGDETGPCACDPSRDSKRSVFDAIRKVFASFYNDNAYLERLRRSVDPNHAGMAILVHHSFPDECELANGVATVEIRDDGGNHTIKLVTQQGAVPVANPVGTSIAEEVVIQIYPSGAIQSPEIKRASSLSRLGETVMTGTIRGKRIPGPSDYLDLTTLLLRVCDEFSQTTGKTTYTLDFEYKKVAPGDTTLPAGGIVVKQVREIPSPDKKATVTPFLLDTSMEFEVFTGEFEFFEQTDVFASHRLKSRWTLETPGMALDAAGLDEGLYSTIRVEYLDDDQVRTIDNMISLTPPAYSFHGGKATHIWHLDNLSNPRTYRLDTTEIPTAVPASRNPIFTLADLGTYVEVLSSAKPPFRCLTLIVDYAQLVMSWDQGYEGYGVSKPPVLKMTQENKVYLWPRTEPSSQDVFQQRSFTANGVSVTTSFYHAPPPEGLSDWVAGATAPLKRWDHTVITGLTSQPIVLEGYYSQTYRPQHHNYTENFLFEPRLEPDLPATTRAELEAINIRLIHLTVDNITGGAASALTTYGFDL